MRMVKNFVLGVAALVCGAQLAHGAGVPVEIDMPALRTIQPYTMEENAADHVYLLVTGMADGKAISQRLPSDKTLEAAPKKPAVTEKMPLKLWTGDLGDGEFALVSITLMQGAGTDTDKVKTYTDKLNAAVEKVPELSKKTLSSDDDLTKLATANVKAEKGVITKIKDIFSRDAKTDHYGGLFTIIVWNHGGQISKRIDPVGLTFGEHFGTDVKIYSKLKGTRANVLVQDEKGAWSQVALSPTSDDDSTVRVKMLETESIKGGKEPVRHVTDYLADIQVLKSGKPEKWELDGEVTGYDVIHTYWDFAH